MTGELNLGFVVIFGLAVVFICLIALIALIVILGILVKLLTKKSETPAAPAVAPAIAPAAAPVNAAPAAVSSDDKQKIIAAIGAAIAEDMGTDVAHIKIHSIKKI